MTRSEFKKLFDTKTDRLNSYQLIEFGLNICERLLPDYISFSEKHQWGDVELLRECIMFCREVKDRDVNYSDVKGYLDRLDPHIPDTEDSGDFDGSYALNASAVVYELIEYLGDKNSEHIYNISTYMTDSIDFKLSEANPSLANQILENHPDIINEWRYQLSLLADVEIETEGVKFDPTINYGSSDLSDERNLALYKFAELIKNLITLSSNADRQIEIIGYGAVCDEIAEDFHTNFTLSFQSYVKYGLLEPDQIVRLTDLDIFC